jgi:hypothetical protein
MFSAIALVPRADLPRRRGFATHTGLLQTAQAVATAFSQVDAQMQAVQTLVTTGGCSAAFSSTAAASVWKSAYQAWQTLNASWLAHAAAENAQPWYDPPGLIDEYQDQGYLDQLNAGFGTPAQPWVTYATTVQGAYVAACPGAAPVIPTTPAPGTPGVPPVPGTPASSWACQAFGWGCGGPSSSSGEGDWATTIQWLAAAAIVVVIGVEVWPVLAPSIVLGLSKL